VVDERGWVGLGWGREEKGMKCSLREFRTGNAVEPYC